VKSGGAKIVVRALEDEGIEFAFGIPGTHNIELYDALAGSARVRAVLVTDEQSASFMADGAWRASGRMACVNVVPGAGLTHALSGIAEAFMDGVPMLVLGCGIRQDTGRAYQLHDVNQLAIARPVTKAQLRPERGEEIYAAIREACRIARDGTPGPVFVEIPANLYLLAQEASFAYTPPSTDARVPNLGLLDDALELFKGKRVLLYAGLGASGVDLVELAERLDAPVATTFSGKGVFPETHPLFLWCGFGNAAPEFARRIAGECEAALVIGARFGEVATGSYGVRPPRPMVHVDISPEVIGRNFEADIAITAGAAEFVAAMTPRVESRTPDAALRQRIAAGHRDAREDWERAASRDKVTPSRLLSALQARFGRNSVFVTDSGNGTFLAMEMLRLEKPRSFLAPVDYSCMGYSVPAALGAKLAAPERPVIALAGDGAFLMTGLELLTAAYEGINAAVFVLRDRELAQIAQFQSVAMNRKTKSILPDYDLGSLCAGMGVECLSLGKDKEIVEVLSRVADIIASGRPAVVDVAIDYSERTFFTKGVIKTTLERLPWRERMRFIGRAVARRVLGGGGGGSS
jgi:acetolactate synthase I/II/III large subunit